MTRTWEDTFQGVSAPEAARRLAEDGPNELPTATQRNFARQAWDVMRQPMLRAAFNFGPIEPTDWVVAVGAGCLGVAWFEVFKAWARR